MKKREHLVAVALFVFTVFCLSDVLLPTFDQINAFDDSHYIRSGRRLIDLGEVPPFNVSVLTAMLYGFVYAVVQDSPNWFVYTAMAGRVATFGLFWLGVYSCARSCARLTPSVKPVTAMTLAFSWLIVAYSGSRWTWVTPDFLFMAMAAFALSHLLAFRSSERIFAHLGWASAFVGLSALSRQDGLILFISFLLLAAWLARETARRGVWVRTLAVAGLPFATIVGGYLLLYAVLTGTWFVGTMERTYFAFEQGHGVTFSERYGRDGIIEGMTDARLLFGESADNGGSVFRAISRNPGAFLDRVVRTMQLLPGIFYRAYGGSVSLIFFLLVLSGMVFLWRSKARWLLVMLLVWRLHLLSYFVTFWDQRYARFAFVQMVLLGVLGVGAATSSRRVSLLMDRVFRRLPGGVWPRLVATPVICMAIIGAGGYYVESHPLRRAANIGASPAEQALAFIVETLPSDGKLAAHGGKLAAASRKELVPFGRLLFTENGASVNRWLEERRVDAIYVDGHLDERFSNLILQVPESGGDFVVGFADPASGVYVLVRSFLGRGSVY